MNPRIETFLSARLHLVPQVVGDQIYFVSNLSGHLSLYSIHEGGSVPVPLLPPHIALQNPDLIGGRSFYVFPKTGQILVMIDQNGDENYQPMVIPMEGGFPEPAFNNYFSGYRVHLGDCDPDLSLVYLSAESRTAAVQESYRGSLADNRLEKLDASPYHVGEVAHTADHSQIVLLDAYTFGDVVLYGLAAGKKTVYYGKLIDDRQPEEEIPLNGINGGEFAPSGMGLLVVCAVFDDRYSLGYLDLNKPGLMQPVKLEGVVHTGVGEMTRLVHARDNQFCLGFNIDGCDWLYEGVFDEAIRVMSLRSVLVGKGTLSDGVLGGVSYDSTGDRYALSFSTAVSPTQIYTIVGKDRTIVKIHTEERLLGISEKALSKGEDASFVSFDGTRISARLYLPAPTLGFKGPRPVVYYIHGGPQGQERPDFAWFSMPLIQHLAVHGFAVFVPNVRGSTGYGMTYTKQVDHDWGGKDRLDHVHAMTKVLTGDPRLDVRRAAVVGRSYGGYMTLTLAGRDPGLWSAACDMFGPYNLTTFMDRIPETWKPYFAISLADPSQPDGLSFLQERSPHSYLDNLACPMLVIQGRNDPRVVARESEDLVADLKKKGKDIQILIFEDEGHDVLKYQNRVSCYNAITKFFTDQLKP